MTERGYNRLNNLAGWAVFAVAAITYLLTLEPTASFWDCGEYIAQSYNMEIGHPPGNPMFVLTARFFANFAQSPEQVAVCINTMSALLSAGASLLLFWTVTILASRMLCGRGFTEMTRRQALLVIGSGLCGALAYTWCDTAWFSAVEAEVYAYSSFCTALTIWLALKWDARADRPESDRYLIAIAYVIGLSIGVHLLNLLCVPVVAVIVYYRKVERTHWWTTLPVLIVSLAIIMFVLYGIVPGSLHIAESFELLAVNHLGMPFNTGALAYVVLLAAVAVATLVVFHRRRRPLLMKIFFLLFTALSGVLMIAGENLYIPALLLVCIAGYLFVYCKKMPVRVLSNIVLYIAVILIGFSVYVAVVVRASAMPTLNMNRADNVFDLAAYIDRDQYGSNPLFYGPVYPADNTMLQRDKKGNAVSTVRKRRFEKVMKTKPGEKDAYREISPMVTYKYADEVCMFLPRIYSPAHASNYKSWIGGITEHKVIAHVQHGDSVKNVEVMMPSQVDNVKFFLSYQFYHMYWRYMMFNFVGRQNDINGNGEVTQGNWICGIPLIDNARLGDQSMLPAELGRDNAGHNVYYGLPLLLGLLGLLWQTRGGREGKRQAWVVFLLFFMTGAAIILYLNQVPGQARERDYSFAGSFYAYCIWIGLGVIGLHRLIFKVYRRLKHVERVSAWVAVAAGVIVPVQMVSQTWDDHDRTGRRFCRDYARDLLISTEKDNILFNSGDNYSFPLWYIQEVEHFRTDSRTLNTDYMMSWWYNYNAPFPYFDSPAIGVQWKPDSYAYRRRKSVKIDTTLAVVPAIDALRRMYDSPTPTMPGSVTVPVDYDALVRRGAAKAEYASLAAKEIVLIFRDGGNLKVDEARLVSTDMIATNAQRGWPMMIYYAKGTNAKVYRYINSYMAQTGLTLELTPFRQDSYISVGAGYSDRAYDNFMHRFSWGGLDCVPDGKRIYLDEINRHILTYTRLAMLDLARRLIKEGEVTLEASEGREFQLLPASVKTREYAMDRFRKAGDILTLKDTKLPETVALSNYELCHKEADMYYQLARLTGDASYSRRADALISATIDRFSQHMLYFQSLASWQPLAQSNKLVFNEGGYLQLLASYYDGNPKAARRKIAEAARDGVDIWAAYERLLKRLKNTEAPHVGGSRLWSYLYSSTRTLRDYDRAAFEKMMKKDTAYGIAVERADQFHGNVEAAERRQLLDAHQ